MDKLVDEYLKGVATSQIPVLIVHFGGKSGLITGATISLCKVRNLRGEQNSLERLAKDSESLVCQVSQTLSSEGTRVPGDVLSLWLSSHRCRVGRDTRNPD